MNEQERFLEELERINEHFEYELRHLKDRIREREILNAPWNSPFGVTNDERIMDEYYERTKRLELEKHKMIEELMRRGSIYNQKIDQKSEDKSEISDAIDELYKRKKLKDDDKIDIIVRKVGKKYVAEIDNRRDQKIKEIMTDDE
jgi:hypothetical protein